MIPAPATKSINKYNMYDPKSEIGSNLFKDDPLNDLLDMICGDQRGISDYWRKNTSSIEASELANILRALNKVAGHIGRNAGQVEWAGMSHNTNGNIVIDPSAMMGNYPVPPSKFDYLVGVVVHEAMHQTEWSDYLWKTVNKNIPEMKMSEKIVFQKIIYTGENIYVDSLADKSVLGLYARIPRKVAMGRVSRFLGNRRISVDALVYHWWQISFGEDIPNIKESYKTPLAILVDLGNELVKSGGLSKGATGRCEFRSQIYIKVWEKIKGLISSWDVVDKTLCWYPEATRLEKTTPQRKARSVVHLSKATIHNIEERLAYNSSDITPIIRSIVGHDNKDIVPTSRWDFNIPAHPVIDYKLVARLKGILQNYSDRRTILNKGLTSGRVDRRKLYRAPINGRCFFEKQKIPLLDWNICLLVDATGSMKGPKWRMVENTLGTIHRAFSGFENRLQAFAYFEVEGVCMISNLIKEKRILSIPPCGQTASGQAIIAAAHFMPDDNRRRFIIHITDGESNFGCDVGFGIEHCRARHIHLVTIGVAYKDPDAMQKQYGKTIQFVDHFGQLPSAIEKLLKWALLNNKTHVAELGV
ncbi:MAG: vWA domain-containing protein [Desulfosalsimonadaceae bacterium]